MKYLNRFMRLMLLPLAGFLSFMSCQNEDDTGVEHIIPGEYQYSFYVPNANDEMTILLDSIISPIKKVGNCPDWVTVNVLDDMYDGHPMLKLILKDSGPNTANECEVILESEIGDRVTLSLTQSLYLIDNTNSMEYFLTDWENQDTVSIYSGSAEKSIPTPWADETSTTIPESVRCDVKKKDGWEMAFSFLNNKSFDDVNYFALYNRYLGTLRIFLYVTDVTTNASEYSFEVDMGSSGKKNKFPFYHALAYGIPAGHTSLSNNVNLLGDGVNPLFTFKSFFSPYRSVSSTALIKGWTAFDIDASAYCSADKNWLDSGEQMQISCRTIQKQAISLAGNISANISGKYSSAEQTASASSGVSSMLSTAGSIIGDVRNSALAAIEKTVTGKSLDTYCYYIGAACNVASFAYDYLMSNKYEESVTDSMPGKIEMSMTGDIDLSGYITSFTPNPISSVTFRSSTIKNTNADSHFGQGVWGLESDPVMYVVENCFLGDVNRFNLSVNGDGTYGNPNAEDFHFRMVSFLDPTTIHVNINKEVFPDISDVSVTWNYGVYPDVEKGHTTKYVSLLGLNRPIVKLIDTNNKYLYRSGKDEKYIQLPHTTFMSKVLEENTENCKVVKQAGSDYSYYGKVVNCEGKNFIMQPQVYFPVKNTDIGTLVYDGEIPDFVVLVTVTFKSDGRTYMFSQRFLPEVKLMKRSEVGEMLDKLNDYSEHGASEANHTSGNACIQKTLDILSSIKNSK